MERKSFDLKKCLKCVQSLELQKYGRRQNLDELEKKFSYLKEKGGPLTYELLNELSSREYWNFDDYWLVPDWQRLKGLLEKTNNIFLNLLEKEEEVIGLLYNIFKNIELVSIILRMVDPKNYAIMSPPTKYAIRKQLYSDDNPVPWDYVTEYKTYLSIIRFYAKRYGFHRVADADLALWVLTEKCLREENLDCNNYCNNFRYFQEEMVRIEEERVRKSQILKRIEEEYLEEWMNTEKEKETLRQQKEEEIKNLKKEIEKLKKEIEKHQKEHKEHILIQDIIKLPICDKPFEQKFQHDKRELPVDEGQIYFMRKLGEFSYVSRIIWSRNRQSKPPTRILDIKDNGELTIVYVNRNNYAAEIKVYPVKCPDMTHARYFAILVAEYMDIPLPKNLYKNGESI